MDSLTSLVCIFCITSGENGENLGSDEEPIIAIVLLIYDISANQIEVTKKFVVRPNCESASQENHTLTEECRIQTGISDEDINAAKTLDQVLEEIDDFLRCRDLQPHRSVDDEIPFDGRRTFRFCTDGQLHFRTCLFPEANRKRIQLPLHFKKFFDIRKEFEIFFKPETPICGLRDVMSFLQLDGDEQCEYGIRQCNDMAAIVQRLLTEGHVFKDAEEIQDSSEPCESVDYDVDIDDETIVRARGLPWQASDQDVAGFFTGLNIARGGVLLCLSEKGRRNGEALVRFQSREQRDLALRRHRHHLGHRYIEIYRANSSDFKEVAGAFVENNSSPGIKFLSRGSGKSDLAIIRMRGLPYSCTTEQVLEFFRSGSPSVEVLDAENGVLFVRQWDGRATGDAFVLFPSEEEARLALVKHKQVIGSRYIELFMTTGGELQQVLSRSLDPRNSSHAADSHRLQQSTMFPPCQVVHPLPPSPSSPASAPASGLPSNPRLRRDCIRLRGLPYDVTVSEILSFLGEFSRHVQFHGVHLIYDSLGRAVGEALVRMDSETSAELSVKLRSGLPFGDRKSPVVVQLTQCSLADVVSAEPSMAVHGLALAANNGGGGGGCTVPMDPTRGVLFNPWEYSNQVHHHSLVSAAHHQMIKTDYCQLLAAISSGSGFYGTPAQTACMVGTNLANSSGSFGLSAEHPTLSLPFQTNSLYSLSQLPMAQPFGLTAAVPPLTIAASYQLVPVLQWYPGTPLSVQSGTLTGAVVMKGLPPSAEANDIVTFLKGFYEVIPDVRMTKGSDDDRHTTREALVTFSSRSEAEKAVRHLNRRMLGDRPIALCLL